MTLERLEAQLREDLQLLEYPPKLWVEGTPAGMVDVAIIGGGMAGLCATFALMREGVNNIRVFDDCYPGFEGPWATCARMLILRSQKQLPGPALGLPRLTFRAWYEAQHGEAAWESLYKIPTLMWMDYLRWYRKVLEIPVTNCCRVSLVEPIKEGFALHCADQPLVQARKVVLATGRAGFGGLRYPSWVSALPKSAYAHTAEPIDFAALAGKRVAIIGAGASGFDAAATALETGCASATMLVRRPAIPNVNKFADAIYSGFGKGYYLLTDQDKLRLMMNARKVGSPPPFESLDRVKEYRNFKVQTGVEIRSVTMVDNAVCIKSSRGSESYDFVVVATGFETDGKRQPELRQIIDDLLLWRDRGPDVPAHFGLYPYLGRHYQFLEKTPGTAPHLKHIYCFNNAAKLSQGITSSDIPDISIGASRLANGIVADLFTQDPAPYIARFEDYNTPEFHSADYPFVNPK